MTDRKDALLAAAKLIVAARELVEEFPPGALHSACGEIQVYPNSPVVVASEATILVDFRSESSEVLEQASRRFMETSAQVATHDGVEVKVIAEHSWQRNPYPPEGITLARSVAEELGLANDTVMTVAGHDSTNMKDEVPTVMLFIPSAEGRSHSVREFTSDEDMLAGLNMFSAMVHKLATGCDH